MRFVRRVVFDTSTLIGAVLMRGSVPRKALDAAFVQYELCGSDATLAELGSVIGRAKFDRYLDQATRTAFLGMIRQHVRLFVVLESDEANLPRLCRDPRDNKFLALALVCDADVVVSSDADLTSMSPYEGIVIVGATDFLAGLVNA